ncbi:hypothetical protein COY87_01145 [Candidatus Roizmanbacteria bacterium CG_4_10_14_0_8_um_filter_33_9]|uniref:Yip1 domain-containing protein n=1 Tax=Candidatus Roizmanbacteria bacterium CG_4_10_14_0_8_um_filter_33_9 TaxID=1974826 RepID=A0A2M7QJA2_9BACT|nr:MAG: hypothetical protein COY87_01145 [Candidatus Roizmanbacteria bacterium CG_4_10_14_0_8_um_filter_33_9]
MVFDQLVNLFASILIVFRRVRLLIFYPYKTMRKISLEKDMVQVGVILFISFLYFMFAYKIRNGIFFGILAFFIFIMLFLITTLFFYWSTKRFNNNLFYNRFVITYSYTLIPTFFWFFTNAIFYVILPPPRTISLLGKGFSIAYLTYSINILVWKLILVYFSLRFSSRLGLIRIIYVFILYLLLLLPLSMLLYQLHIFRIPFI